MATEIPSSNPVDLLHGRSVLFPRTFRESKDALKPLDPDDLDSLHHFMKTKALRNPEKLFEKAKAVLKLMSSEVANIPTSRNVNNVVMANPKRNPQERRPDLGQKRARFSLKPDISRPPSIPEPTLDNDQLQNPKEFFAAYEKFENASKELQKQMGGDATDVKELNSSIHARQRRPSIPGKKVNYKHHVYSTHTKIDSLSSLDTLQHGVASPSGFSSQQEIDGPSMKSQEKELTGFEATTGNKVNDLFDELLSSNIENLDEDEVLSLLQNRLLIKPVDLEKTCLPDFHDVNSTDFVALGGQFPKVQTPLSDKHNLLRGLTSETPATRKNVSDNPAKSKPLPTLPKSPLASISLLGKRILQSSSSSDPYSAHNIDMSPTNSSSIEILHRHSRPISTMELSISRILNSLTKDNVGSDRVSADSLKVPRIDSINVVDNSITDNLNKLGEDANARPIGSLVEVEGLDRLGNAIDKALDKNIVGPTVETEDWMHGNDTLEEDIEVMQQKAAPSTLLITTSEISIIENSNVTLSELGQTNAATNENCALAGQSRAPETSTQQHDGTIEHSKKSPDEQNKTRTRRKGEQIKAFSPRSSFADVGSKCPARVRRSDRVKCRSLEYWKAESQTKPAANENCVLAGPSKSPEISTQQDETCERSKKSLDGQNKAITRHKGEQIKALSRRGSLADAGSKWAGGVRRSNRVKYRPLEYWKGERFLFGRVHESLPTVIGLKYMSPDKQRSKPTFSVKSYVSDDYKNLVEFAALH